MVLFVILLLVAFVSANSANVSLFGVPEVVSGVNAGSSDVDSKFDVGAYEGKVGNDAFEFLRYAGRSSNERFIVAFVGGVPGVLFGRGKRFGSFFAGNLSVGEVLGLLEKGDVVRVELDREVSFLGEVVPWGVECVGALPVWNLSSDEGVRVAVLDSGIAGHEDLVVAGGVSFVSDDYSDVFGYGTQVAGVMGALDNDVGIVGVAPGAELYAVKVADSFSGRLSDAVAGVLWAVENGMDVVVMSFGLESRSEIFEDDDYGVVLVKHNFMSNGTKEIIATGINDTRTDLFRVNITI